MASGIASQECCSLSGGPKVRRSYFVAVAPRMYGSTVSWSDGLEAGRTTLEFPECRLSAGRSPRFLSGT